MKFRIEMTGTRPLIMNNSRAANPMYAGTKELKALTGKQKKTEDDHQRIFKAGYAVALYYDSDFGLYLPGDNIWRCLYDGATKHRLGEKVKQGLLIDTEQNPLLDYPKIPTVDELYADDTTRLISMRVTGTGSQKKRVPFCRPRFKEWHVKAYGTIDDGILDIHELELIAETAGERVGVGDWRPRYGQFQAEIKPLKDAP